MKIWILNIGNSIESADSFTKETMLGVKIVKCVYLFKDLLSVLKLLTMKKIFFFNLKNDFWISKLKFIPCK